MGDLAMLKNQNEVDCVYTILVVSNSRDCSCEYTHFTYTLFSLVNVTRIVTNTLKYVTKSIVS